MSLNIDKIKKRIDKYDIISFDIFDTLIKRNLNNYQQIYEMVEKRCYERYNLRLENFKNYRILSEKKITTEDFIPNINDIYNSMKEFTIEQRNKIKNIEFEIEQEYCQCNYDIKPLYDYCLEKGKKIIITSDMYLDKKNIIKLLDRAGIYKYYKIFISCEYNASKRNKKLYEFVIKEMNVNPGQILHIGDSKISDYLMAEKSGINSVLISKKNKKTEFLAENEINNIDYGILYNFINNNIELKNKYYNFGYEVFGPVLYSYTHWLINKLKEKKINKVFFLAREGNLLKKSFDIMNNDETIKSHYLYCSRRSTRVPLLNNINTIDDVFKIVRMRRIIDIESFFLNVGLDINRYEKSLVKYNLTKEMNINSTNFNLLFEDIKEDVKSNAIQEQQFLYEYLKQENFTGKIAVCDVGWVGTMQKSLCEICSINNVKTEILGFYVGLNPEYKKNGMTNYMFDYMFENSQYKYLNVASFLNLFECLFLAQHGTTVKYTKENGTIVPVLKDYEYNMNEAKIFMDIQSGAIDFVKKFRYDLDKNICLYKLFRVGMHPSLRNIKMFKNMKYVETKKFNFVNTCNLVYYLLHPKKMYTDFCNCSWKIGFMKNLFKINLNYYKIYEQLNKYK